MCNESIYESGQNLTDMRPPGWDRIHDGAPAISQQVSRIAEHAEDEQDCAEGHEAKSTFETKERGGWMAAGRSGENAQGEV